MKRKIIITIATDDDSQLDCRVEASVWPQKEPGEQSRIYDVAISMLQLLALPLGPTARITVDGRPLSRKAPPTVREAATAAAGRTLREPPDED